MAKSYRKNRSPSQATRIFYILYSIFLLSSYLCFLEIEFLALFYLMAGSFLFTMVGMIFRMLDAGGIFFETILGGLIIIIAGFFMTRYLENRTIANGNEIIQALEVYYRDHQTFPETLAELSPDYMDQIPYLSNRVTRQSFLYWRINEDNFELCFPSFAFYTYRYTYSGGEWDLGAS